MTSIEEKRVLKSHRWKRRIRNLLLTTFVIILCILLIGYVDKPTLLLVKETITGDLKVFFRHITDLGKADAYVWGSVLLFLGGRAMMSRTKDAPKLLFYQALSRCGLFVMASLALSAVFIHTMKLAFGRPRPKVLFNEDFYGFRFLAFDTDFNSFPSGHSQTVWAVMIPLVFLFPKWRYFFIATAIVIASSRVLVAAHYPSDVIMGSYIAIMCALFVHRKWFNDLKPVPWPKQHIEAKDA
jgi:membrane-associated phospholipid phosphatase